MNRAYAYLNTLLHMPKNFKALLLHLFLLIGLVSSSAALPDTLGLVISTDNANEVYLNGVLLGTGNDWAQSRSYSAALQNGTNVLAVKGIDAGGVAALIAELTLPGGKVVSDATWKVSATAAAGWETLGFNDSAWPAATQYGQYGVGPWFKNVTGFPSSSTANWIWTADSNNDDTAYFRYTFTVGSAPLAVSTSTLTDGVLGTAYTQTLAATGGTPPYTWSVVAGSLPVGLSLNAATGVISGTPNASGTSNFTVRVTDTNSATVARALTLTVTNAPPAVLGLVISTDNANEVYLNGVLLGTGNDWAQSRSYSAALQNGTNVLAVKGIDAGGVAALIAELTLPGGKVVSDATWKVSATAASGWEALGFNDSAWPAATQYGQYGVGPWFKNVTGFPSSSTANWIWTADSNNDDTAYFRYTFTVGAPPANVAPTVSITGPADGSPYAAPASVTLSATASDSDGSIAAVEFYNGSTLIASLTTTPYTYTWSNVPIGNYSVRARAVDNLGAATYSSTITINVNAVVASGVYYVYADHLNTPRVITDSSNKVVWRWDSDPFGTDTANEDPDGDGAKFRYNPRFPGQYYDKETGLHYNYFRDYEPTTGRYVEADPIGLEGGMNLYGYVGGNPIGMVDPLGLWSISFEGYVGLGGGIIFGRDSNTGQSFITLRGGYGFGGGFDYDPLATRPGSEECKPGQESNPSGEALGLFGKVGGRLGPLKGGLGANAGLQNGASALPVNPYGSFAKPKASFTNRGTGISASAAAGAEFTIYGKGSCGCPK